MKKENLLIFSFFFILSLIITLPLFLPGYILTLDMVPVPEINWPSFWQPNFFIFLINQLFNTFLPSFWFPKIILFLIIFFSGVSMAGLVETKNAAIKLFAGTLYGINPFVYERIMAGHWFFLLGYAILPWVIGATMDLFQKPGIKPALKLALLVTLLFNLFLHFTLIFALFFILYGIIYLIFYFRELISERFYFLGLCLLFILILNLNWLLPILFGSSQIVDSLSSFSRQDLIAFQSVADPNFGLVFNLLSGFGFWGEVYDYFIPQKLIVPFWPLISLSIIALFLTGLFHLLTYERKRESLPLKISLVIIFILALDFAGGIALKQVSSTVYFLYEKVPLLMGFREPQKLISLVMLGYAFFSAEGIEWLLSFTKKGAVRLLLPLVFLLLPFIYTPTVFGSFWGQLRPVDYPDSWYRVNEIINRDSGNFMVLFFPWHQYMRFNFNHNLVIANPAPKFFDKPILAARNYETAPLYSHDQRPEALHVEGLLSIEEKGVNLLGHSVDYEVNWSFDLSPIDVKYIILARDSDWKRFLFLDRDSNLVREFEDESLILYRNLAFGQEPIYPKPEPSPASASPSAGLENPQLQE